MGASFLADQRGSMMSHLAKPANYFAENVSRMAGMHGLSLDQLARLLGLSPQTISMWRTGKRSAGGEALMAVGSFFEIDPVALSRHSFQEVLPLLANPARYASIESKIEAAKMRAQYARGPS
jgi:transcriptional regulator with XRE-family HTH domain